LESQDESLRREKEFEVSQGLNIEELDIKIEEYECTYKTLAKEFHDYRKLMVTNYKF
jgi:hypothetical protein